MRKSEGPASTWTLESSAGMRKDEFYITDFGANVQYPSFKAGMWRHSRLLNVEDVDVVFTCVSGVITASGTARERAGTRRGVSNAGERISSICRHPRDRSGEQRRWRHIGRGSVVMQNPMM